MNVNEIPGGIEICGVSHFNLVHIFKCGQCFRWEEQPDGSFIGIAKGKVVQIKTSFNNITILNANLQDFFDIWQDYFDLNADYGAYKNRLMKDSVLKKAIPYGAGIRILKQDTFEALISFIISASNNIPRITKIVNLLCENFGEELEFNGKKYYTFPTPKKLAGASLEDLAIIRAGYRAEYIMDAAKRVACGEIDLNKVKNMPSSEAQKYLMQIKGVGPKVADCILIFGAGRLDVFPVDTWIDKAMKTLYPGSCNGVKVRKAGETLFGDICGLAQQYLFYYARENKIKME